MTMALPNIPAEILNGLASGAATRQATVAAAGSRVRVVYGRQMIGADVFFVGTLGTDLVLGCGWCLGEIDAVEQVYINGAVPASTVTQTHYLGTATQGVDATLAAAKTGYADTLVTTFAGKTVAGAYSVLRIPGAASSGYPRVEAIIRGRKVYVSRENLFIHSEDLTQSAYSKLGISITSNDTAAPDGAVTADRVTVNTSGAHYLYQGPPLPAGRYTLSFWVKAGNRDSVEFGIYRSGFVAQTATVLTGPGSVSGTTLITLTGLSTSAWTRVSVTTDAAMTAGTVAMFLYPGTSAGNEQNNYLYFWGFQLNSGAQVNNYVATTSEPAFSIWQNRLLYSEQFDLWSVSGGASVTSNQTSSPYGTTTADALTSSSVSGFVYQNPSTDVVGSAYTFSIYVKNSNATASSLRIAQSGGTIVGSVTLNWSGATLSSLSGSSHATFSDAGNGWYRVSLTATLVESAALYRIYPDLNASGKTIYIWGAQVNDEGAPYPYTRTTTAIVDSIYSANPAFILRDLIASSVYGQGLDVETASVTNVAAACDQLLADSSPRRALNIAIDKPAPAAQWVDVIAEYAGCYIVRDGATVKLVPNRPAASVASLTASHVVAGSLRLAKRSSRRAPTVVRVNYTDTASVPWQDKPAYAYADGVLTGDTPWREEAVDMPGIITYAQALRVATERLNAATLTDLDAEFVTFDEGLAYQEGDVIDLTYPHHGLAAKTLRVRTIEHERPGRWRVTANEYSAAIYSDTVAAGPGADTGLPSPDSIEPPTSIVIASGSAHLLLMADGTIISRMLVTWTAPANLYFDHVDVEFRRNGDAQWTRAPALVDSAYCAPVEDGSSYDVRVRAVNSFGVTSTWVENVHVVVGKTEAPPAPQSFLVSTDPDGTRRFTWSPPASPPLDLHGYKIRYKLGSGHLWADMAALHEGVLTSSPYESNQLAAGTYTFALVTVDTTGNVSAAVYIEGALPDPRLAGVLEIAEPHALGWPGTKTNCWVDSNTGQLLGTDSKTWSSFPTDGVTWANWNEWARASNTMTYTHTTIDAGIVTKFTPLVSVSGVGTQTIEIRTSSDGSTWSSWAAPAGPVTARYLDARVSMSGNGARLDTMTIILDAAPITEDIADLATSTLTGSYRIAAGDIRLPITEDYGLIRGVSITLQNVGAGWSWELIDKDTAVGPRVKIYNASNVLADATIDANVRGV